MGKSETWIWWRNKGFSPEAVSAIMGNIGPESAFRSNNVEDRCPLSDAEYTKRVDTGQYSKEWFMYDGPNNKDGQHYGYGYYQHTLASRKAGLWDMTVGKGRSISDENGQHEWAYAELHQPEYLRVLNKLQSKASIAEMTREFMLYFEKPYDQSENAIAYRVSIAQGIYDEFGGTPTYWPPRILTKGMTGPDVYALQGLLCAHGYYKGSFTGCMDDATIAAGSAFKIEEGLSKPESFGNKAWNRLLRR